MTGYGKKQAMQQGELLFAINNQVLKSAYEWLATCWHLLRSDEIALIVQKYRRSSGKNKRHNQVCHCLSNMNKLVVISVGWVSSWKTHYFRGVCGHYINRHTLRKTRPHHSSLLPKPHTSRHYLHVFPSPKINCCFLIEQATCTPETSSHGALQELQHVHFQLKFLQSNWTMFFIRTWSCMAGSGTKGGCTVNLINMKKREGKAPAEMSEKKNKKKLHNKK